MSLGKINVYVCPCGHQVVTIDVDEGVTPFMIPCPTGCKPVQAGFKVGLAQSSFYQVDQRHEIPEWEWYKPSSRERKTLGFSRAELEYIKQGGLMMRELTPERRRELGRRFNLFQLQRV